jgi:hypothetical protein
MLVRVGGHAHNQHHLLLVLVLVVVLLSAGVTAAQSSTAAAPLPESVPAARQQTTQLVVLALHSYIFRLHLAIWTVRNSYACKPPCKVHLV